MLVCREAQLLVGLFMPLSEALKKDCLFDLSSGPKVYKAIAVCCVLSGCVQGAKLRLLKRGARLSRKGVLRQNAYGRFIWMVNRLGRRRVKPRLKPTSTE